MTRRAPRRLAALVLVAAAVGGCAAPGSSAPRGPAAAPTAPPATGRLAGADRYATAVALSRDRFPGGSDVVVVASGADFADALAAAPAAAGFGAPLLLVPRGPLPAEVRAEVVRLGASTAVLAGGPAAVDPAVEESLHGAGLLTSRVAGADRYGTAARLATTLTSPARTGGTVFVASGEDSADATGAASRGAAEHEPVLLARVGGLPAATAEALRALAPARVVVVGGSARLPAAVVDQVRGELPAADVVRVAGEDRYATSALLQGQVVPAPRAVLLATGEDFPDALAGAALGQPVLLVRPDCVPAGAVDLLLRWRPERMVVLGGKASVTPAAADGSACG